MQKDRLNYRKEIFRGAFCIEFSSPVLNEAANQIQSLCQKAFNKMIFYW